MLNFFHEYQMILIVGGIFLFTIVTMRIVRTILSRYVERSAQSLKVDPTAFNFIKNGINFLILLLALILIFYTIPQLRNIGVTLFASAGIIAAIIGFASQHAFGNIISGTFIVIFKPFRVGDIIKIGQDLMGRVEDITLRHTVIRNFENRRIIIPNSNISSQTIVNSDIVDPKVCVHLEVTISYDSEIDRAMQIIRDLAMAHSMCLDNRTDEQRSKGKPVVVIRVIELGEFGVLLRAWIWAKDVDDAFIMKCDLLKQIKEKFQENGVEIPYPHRTVVIKKGRTEDDPRTGAEKN
ncbi:mechanosensitive ion channel family protein [candidate division KSB1 bacterium]|nr:mechanosensitive ion channel family protein [candidate division KSB1 bacterium]